MGEYKSHILTAILAIGFFAAIWAMPFFMDEFWQKLSVDFFEQLLNI